MSYTCVTQEDLLMNYVFTPFRDSRILPVLFTISVYKQCCLFHLELIEYYSRSFLVLVKRII